MRASAATPQPQREVIADEFMVSLLRASDLQGVYSHSLVGQSKLFVNSPVASSVGLILVSSYGWGLRRGMNLVIGTHNKLVNQSKHGQVNKSHRVLKLVKGLE